MEDKKESRSKKMYKDSPTMERNEHGKMARSKKPEHKKEEHKGGNKHEEEMKAMMHKHAEDRLKMHHAHEAEHLKMMHKTMQEMPAQGNADQGDAAVVEQAAEGGQGEA